MIFILIDDDPVSILIHKKVIETTCKKVNKIVSFSSAVEALNFFKSDSDYCRNRELTVLLDLNMPEMNGWEFLDQLGSRPDPLSNVYILSSSVAQFDIEKSKRYSAVKGYIVKPLSKPNLEEIVLD